MDLTRTCIAIHPSSYLLRRLEMRLQKRLTASYGWMDLVGKQLDVRATEIDG